MRSSGPAANAIHADRERPLTQDEPAVHVVAYDIGDDATRARVHKLLTGYGEPLQFSVFECLLSRHDLQRLAHALRRQALNDSDRIDLFRCAGPCGSAASPAAWWLA